MSRRVPKVHSLLGDSTMKICSSLGKAERRVEQEVLPADLVDSALLHQLQLSL